MTRFLTTLTAILLVASYAATATAEQGQPSDEDRARELFRLGAEAFANEDYQSALEAFSLSFRLNPVLSVLYNIAMCYRALFRYVESIETFEQYLAEGGPRIPVDRAREVEALVREMEDLVGHLRLRVVPEAAVVELDGEPVELPPGGEATDIRLRPGHHVIRANAPEHREAVRQLDIGPGETSELAIELEPEPETTAPPPPPTPWYRRWWVWTLIGGAVVATGLGVGLGVGLTQDERELGSASWDLRLP